MQSCSVFARIGTGMGDCPLLCMCTCCLLAAKDISKGEQGCFGHLTTEDAPTDWSPRIGLELDSLTSTRLQSCRCQDALPRQKRSAYPCKSQQGCLATLRHPPESLGFLHVLFVPCRSSTPSSETEEEDALQKADMRDMANRIVVEDIMQCNLELEGHIEQAQHIVAEAEALLSSQQFRRNMLFK